MLGAQTLAISIALRYIRLPRESREHHSNKHRSNPHPAVGSGNAQSGIGDHAMRTGIHPEYIKATMKCACGNS
jgi:hypothetical protein